jgi:hypothetical protein
MFADFRCSTVILAAMMVSRISPGRSAYFEDLFEHFH